MKPFKGTASAKATADTGPVKMPVSLSQGATSQRAEGYPLKIMQQSWVLCGSEEVDTENRTFSTVRGKLGKVYWKRQCLSWILKEFDK